jgi:hypothetical protein
MILSTTRPDLLKSFYFGFSIVLRLALPVVFVLAAVTLVVGQTQAGGASSAPTKPNEQPAKAVKPAFTLRITTEGIIGLSLKAEDVKLSEIAAELSKKLKIPVVVSTIMQKQRVTTNFSDLVLEPALQMLAPQVYIDYEIDSTPGIPARPLGIYFQGYNERPPADTAVVRGTSDVMVIEGNTEDVPEEKKDGEEGELKVTYEKGELSVKSKKQPLVVVLYGIANELGIPLEVKNEVLDPVTINIQKSSVESVLQQLGSNIRLYVRADLQLQQRRPLRMVLVAPEKKS